MKFAPLQLVDVGSYSVTHFTCKLDSYQIEMPPLQQMAKVLLAELLFYSSNGALSTQPGRVGEVRATFVKKWNETREGFLRVFGQFNTRYGVGSRRPTDSWLHNSLEQSQLSREFQSYQEKDIGSAERAGYALVLLLAMGRMIDKTDNYGDYLMTVSGSDMLAEVTGYVIPEQGIAQNTKQAADMAYMHVLEQMCEKHDFYSDKLQEHPIADLILEIRKYTGRHTTLEAGASQNPIGTQSAEKIWHRMIAILTVMGSRAENQGLPQFKDTLCAPAYAAMMVYQNRFEEWLGTYSMFEERFGTATAIAFEYLNDQLLAYKPQDTIHPETAIRLRTMMKGQRGKVLANEWVQIARELRSDLIPNLGVTSDTRELTLEEYHACLAQPTVYLQYPTVSSLDFHSMHRLRVQGQTYRAFEHDGFAKEATMFQASELIPGYFLVDQLEHRPILFGSEWIQSLRKFMHEDIQTMMLVAEDELRTSLGSVTDFIASKDGLYSKIVERLNSPLMRPPFSKDVPNGVRRFAVYFDIGGYEVYPIRVVGQEPVQSAITRETEPGEYIIFTRDEPDPGDKYYPVDDWDAQRPLKLHVEEAVQMSEGTLIAGFKYGNLEPWQATMTQYNFETKYVRPPEIWMEYWLQILDHIMNLPEIYKKERKLFTRDLAVIVGREVAEPRYNLNKFVRSAVEKLRFANTPMLLLRAIRTGSDQHIMKQWFITRCVAEIMGERTAERSSKTKHYGDDRALKGAPDAATTEDVGGALYAMFTGFWDEAFALIDKEPYVDQNHIIH